MKIRTLIKEFFLLLVLFILTWLLAFWLTHSKHLLNPVLDIGLNQTYFILSWKAIVITPFLMFATLIYFIREIKHLFKRKSFNLILLSIDFLCIIQLFRLFAIFPSLMFGGWTIYPPLSALASKATLFAGFDKYQNLIRNYRLIMLCILIIFLLILVIAAIFTGKNWKLKDDKALHS